MCRDELLRALFVPAYRMLAIKEPVGLPCEALAGLPHGPRALLLRVVPDRPQLGDGSRERYFAAPEKSGLPDRTWMALWGRW